MYDEAGGTTADYDPRSGQLTNVQPSGTYSATRAQIDVQIATAKAYPRLLHAVSKNLITYCAGDNDTAESCVYSLKRGNKTIRGPSIRFAEILAHAWGHMRVDARIIDEGRDFIVVRGECHDLQTNNVWAQDVTRRITNSAGKRYDADLIGVTMMAAASIAQRDSVLKCIPAFIWRPAFDACMQRIVGDVKLLSDRRIKAVGQFSVLGVSAEQVFRKLGVASLNDITLDHVVDLIGTFNAIREQHTTVEVEFGDQRITTPSLGGSPLGAPEDDDEGDKSDAKEVDRDAGQRQPAAQKDAPEKGRADRAAAEVAAADLPPAKPRAERQPRNRRQDRDAEADAGREASQPARAAEAPAPKPEPAPAPKPAAAQPEAKPEPKPAAPAEQKGRYLDAEGGTSPQALLRFWENDCGQCSSLDQLRALAVKYGPQIEGKLNEEQEADFQEVFEATKERIEKEQAERTRKAAAEAYERAQNGDEAPPSPPQGGGAPAPAAAQEQPATVQRSPMIERCADMAPSDPEHRKLWESIIERLDAASNKQGVLERYAEMEADGTIAKLPEDAALNSRTARYRVKQSKTG